LDFGVCFPKSLLCSGAFNGAKSLYAGDPLRMAAARVQKDALPPERALQMRESLLSLLPTLPVFFFSILPILFSAF
jgi:hypothetical protein